MTMDTFGIIGFTEDNVGIDRRIYTGSAINGETDPILPVSYNGGRVDVYLNGIKLVGDHSEMPSGTRDYTFTQTGQGSSITIRTGVALVSADVIECIGHVSGSGKTVSTYTPSVSAGDNTFNSSTTGMNGFTLAGSDLLNVYLNGVLLDSSDYTSDASADSVTITSLASGDVVHIQVIGALDYANFVPAGGGTFSGNVAYTGNIQVDDIVEKTSAHGVEIDGVTLKDGGGTFTGTVGVGSDSSDAAAGKLNVKNGTNAEVKDLITVQGYRYSPWQIRVDDTTTSVSKFQVGFSNNTEALSITDGGEVTITDGDLKIGTAGHGINFDAYATSGNPSSNLLDDYEEGTFTPVFANITVNNGVVTGKYTKIGNLVNVYGAIKFGSGTTGPSSTITSITGLPFTSQHGNSDEPLTVLIHFRDNLNYDIQGFAALNHSASTINSPQRTVTSSYQITNLTTPFSWTTGDVLSFTATYRT